MMEHNEPIKIIPLSDYSLWEAARRKRTLLSVTLELTARCNNRCAHCYINLPANDVVAMRQELITKEIKGIVDEAISLGALWFLLSGGEPLLRDDFLEIYTYIKRKGALVSVFTNATLITAKHVSVFKKYPPRDIEVSVYGVTPETYENVTGNKTFRAAMGGIDRLIHASLPVSLKTIVSRANYRELDQIMQFCRERSVLPFRFDPFLNLRIDHSASRNERIKTERLSVEEILEIEKKDNARNLALKSKCRRLKEEGTQVSNPANLFRCQAGINSCCIGYAGDLKTCSLLTHPACVYDLRKGNLTFAWKAFFPNITELQAENDMYQHRCGECEIVDLCMWCPATAYLETGQLDGDVPYFCSLAHRRRDNIYECM